MPRRAPPTLQATPFAPTLLPSTSGSPVDCVILAPDSLADVYQRLADYQTRTGRATVVRTLSTIRAADPRSNDLAQAIRSFLKSAHDLWGIRWAVLAGDHDTIPLRLVEVRFSEVTIIPSDAYYADLDGTWDGNGNGIFGEVADNLDMEPDIAVGRLSASTRAEAQVLVAKALRYAVSPPIPTLQKQLILAEVLFPRDWSPGQLAQVDGGIDAESLRVRAPACATVDRVYENTDRFPTVTPLTPSSALTALNRGYNIVYHVGHGSRSQLSFGPGVLTVTDLATMSNGDSAALWVSSNCASAAVDFDCVGERLTRRADGGALAYVGCTRDDWPGAAAKLNRRLQEELFGASERSLGEAVENARASLLPAARDETQERWSYFETVLLGSPALPIWRCTPATLVVTRPATVPLHGGSFLVTVNASGAPVESALVVAWKAGEDYRAVLTNAMGQATVPFHPATSGNFSLTVTRRDALPFLDSLAVASTAPAHYAAIGVAPNDALGGNGHGLVGAGETFGLSGTIRNSGGTAGAGPLTLEIQSLTPGVTVTKGIAILPALAASAQIAVPDSLRFLALATPNQPRVERLRLIARDAGRADTSVVDMSVTAPSLLMRNTSFLDPVAAGNNVRIVWDLANAGDGRASGVTITGANPVAGVTFVDSFDDAPDILPGQTAFTGLTSAVTVHLTSVPADRWFDVTLADQFGHQWIFPIRRNTTIPAPAGLRVLSSGVDRIAIGWDAVTAPHLAGYTVSYFNPAGGPVVAIPVPLRLIPQFEIAGLPPLSKFTFSVNAVDSSGVPGALAMITASTTPPSAVGWPADLGAVTSSSVCLADLDADGRPEIIAGAEALYVFRSDGTDWIDGDANPGTTGVFSTLTHNLPSAPAAADVNLDGVPEIIAASWDDMTVSVFRPNGTLLPGWPKAGNAPFWSSPAVGNIDGDSGLEIVIGSNAARLYAWNADGSEVQDGDSNPATDGVFFEPNGTVISSPAIADLNGDGIREVIFGTSAGRVYAIHPSGPITGWPFILPGGLMSASPAIGDIVPGGGLEVAMACSNDSVYVLTAGGTRAPGWPRPLELTPGNGRVTSPALAPLRKHLGDPSLCVVVAGADGRVVAYSGSGGILPGWESVQLGAATEASPAVADLDGDGSLEVLIGAEDRRLHAFRADGTGFSGFPIEIGAEARSTPAVWDVDGDGACEIILAGWDQKVHAWRYPGVFTSAGMAWPMFRHDNWHTGVATFPVLTSADTLPTPEPTPEAPAARAVLQQNRPNPFNPETRIGFTVPGTEQTRVRMRVYTVDGRLVRTLVSRALDPGYHEARWNGRDDRGEEVSSGVYICRAEIGSASLTRKMALLR
ncbi:MAG TPA: C25 family cysteine peptidase [Candidatus Eisenbacteria bacterium]|nr:C25 family cysteine peptidase [Candidatus Eisenbacteria bacterium]